MRPVRRRDAGLNLVELRITIAILAILLVIVALAVYGPSWSALKVIGGVPLALLVFACVMALLAGAFFVVMQARTILRVRNAMALVRAGSPDAESVAGAIDRAWGAGERLSRHQGELVALLRAPIPMRNAAIRLLLASDANDRIDVDEALVAGAAEWPEDLFVGIWRLTRTEPARLALATALLSRAGAESRRGLFESMFAKFTSCCVPDPGEPWIRLLAPFADEIAEANKKWGMDESKVAAYAAAFDAAKRTG